MTGDSSAGRQRRCDLPCGQHEGRVPGGNDPDRANRTARGDIHLVAGKQALPVTGGWRLVGKEPKIFGPAKCRLRHEADRLTRIDTFQKRDFLGPRDDTVGDAVQDGAALRPVHVAPGGKGVMRCLCSSVDVVRGATRHRGDRRQIDRRNRFECSTGAGFAILATNAVQNWLAFISCQQLPRPVLIVRE